MKAVFVVIAILCASVPATSVRSAEATPSLPKVQLVVDRLNDLYRADSSEARMSMKVVTAHYQRELTLQAWTRGKKEALVVVRAPARDAGAATLRSEDGLWSYAPRADQLVRIPSALLSDNWMGSHFTNDDLMRETDFLKDYDASLAWKEEAGKHLLQATLVPKPNAPVVWSRVVFLLDPSDYMPMQAQYFDKDRVVRTLTYSNPHVVAGRRVPFTLLMVPSSKPGESTRVDYLDLKFGGSIDPSLFTQRGLRRVAKQ
jgi:outer membrane lipoprotein-sorting protein